MTELVVVLATVKAELAELLLDAQTHESKQRIVPMVKAFE